MGFIQDLESVFGTSNLYAILNVEKSASDKTIKQAYYKLSLNVHPDRNTDDDGSKLQATKQFQLLSQVYRILSNIEQRKIYDETGIVDSENLIGQDFEWGKYWRQTFGFVTTAKIDEAIASFRCSDEEQESIKKCYLRYNGNLNRIYECVFSIDPRKDDQRLKKMIHGMIAAGQVPSFPDFINDNESSNKKRIRKLEKESKLCSTVSEELSSAIQANSQKRTTFTDMLEQKYCKAKRKKTVSAKKK